MSIRKMDADDPAGNPMLMVSMIGGIVLAALLIMAVVTWLWVSPNPAPPVAVVAPPPVVVGKAADPLAQPVQNNGEPAAPRDKQAEPAPIVQPQPEAKPEQQPEPKKPEPAKLDPIVAGKLTRIELPAAAADAVAGGDGRYLIALMPSVPAAAIIDVPARKVRHQVALKSGKVLLAAGMDHLVVVDPEAKTLHSFSLESGKLEATGTVAEDIRLAALGAASRGPLLLHPNITLGGKRPLLLDPVTLKEGSWKAADEGMQVMHGGEQLRASADGQFFGFWSPNTTPQKQSYLIIQGDALTTRRGWHTAGHVTPNGDGSIIYTGNGKFGPNNEPLPGHGKGANYLLPAQQGPFYLKIDDKNVRLFHEDSDKELANLADVPLPKGINAWDRERFGNDRRVWLIPKHDLIVTLPEDNQAAFYPVQPYKLLADAGVDYVDVAVGAPAAFPERGKEWTHAVKARSSKAGVTYKLDVAPKGMTVEADGTIRWQTPKDFPESNAPVTLVVSAAGAKEVRRNFVLPVRGELPKVVAVAPKNDDPPAKPGKSPPGWTTAAAKDKSYSVNMPAGVKHTNDGMEADLTDGSHAEVKIMPSPKLADAQAPIFLKALVKQFAEGARNLKEQKTGPHPSVGLEMVKGPVTVYMRMVVAGGKVYQLVYVPVAPGPKAAETAAAFFDSFRGGAGVPDAPAPEPAPKAAGPAPKLSWKTHCRSADGPADPVCCAPGSGAAVGAGRRDSAASAEDSAESEPS